MTIISVYVLDTNAISIDIVLIFLVKIIFDVFLDEDGNMVYVRVCLNTLSKKHEKSSIQIEVFQVI